MMLFGDFSLANMDDLEGKSQSCRQNLSKLKKKSTVRAGSFECSIDLLLGVLAGAKAAKVSFHFTFAFVT